ncbi:amidohydrolase family protein [Nakamurella lactea]|uniref:amidohydrolase family protein n=1 Tax=Nakamurella lactea TaxID=459515 RepID=UPI0006868F92|nr:amidohydrolase family protein [Nakamurella lactea]
MTSAPAAVLGEDQRSITVPGLINMHDHLRSFLAPSRASDSAPLAEVVAMAGAAQSVAEPEDYQALTALAAARQVLAGTTTVVDHLYPLRPELLDATLAGYRQVGLRGIVALGIMTRGLPQLCSSVDQIAELAESALPRLGPGRMFLAPVSLRQNIPDDYGRAAVAAAELGIGLYTHIAENHAEVRQSVDEHGRRPVELLADQGFLGPRTVLVHAICLTDSEIRLLAESGTTVVYCPSNHAKLAKPVARVVDLQAAGVRVTLGVDGMESLLHEMRQAIAVQGQAAGRPGVLPTAAALRMASQDGRDALLANGIAADFADHDAVTIDLWSSSTQPLADPEWALVHRAGPKDVRDVTIDGRRVVRDGRLVSAEEQDLVRAARESTSRIAQRAGN